MNLNAAIIDQRLGGVQDEIRAWAADELNVADPTRLQSLAFVYLSVSTLQLSATFRRGDLIQRLLMLPV